MFKMMDLTLFARLKIMQPILQQILLKPYPSEEQSEGGIFVPESVRTVNNKMTVVAIGNKVNRVKKGDTVFRVKDWGVEVEINNEKHYIMNQDAVLAISNIL